MNLTQLFSKKKKILKKFDFRPCSNIGTADKLIECVICPRVLKINLQPLAVKRVNKEQKPCSLFFKRVQRTHSLILVDVPILLKGRQSNFFSKFVWKILASGSRRKLQFVCQRYFFIHCFTIPLDFTVISLINQILNMFQMRSHMKLWCYVLASHSLLQIWGLLLLSV